MSFCLAIGQQAQMEMDLSPVVKTELSMPIHANAARLQNPAETWGSLTFLTTLYCFPLTPCPLPRLFLSTQLCYHLTYIKLLTRACSVYTRNKSSCKLLCRLSKHRYINYRAVRKFTTRACPAPTLTAPAVGLLSLGERQFKVSVMEGK